MDYMERIKSLARDLAEVNDLMEANRIMVELEEVVSQAEEDAAESNGNWDSIALDLVVDAE